MDDGNGIDDDIDLEEINKSIDRGQPEPGATPLEICQYLADALNQSSEKMDGKGYFMLRLECPLHQALRAAVKQQE